MQIKDNIRILRDRLGAPLVDPIVEITFSPEQAAFLGQLGLPGHADTHGRGNTDLRGLTPDVGAALLLGATVPGGPLDPAQLGGDVIWVQAVKATLEIDVVGASRLARRWFAHLTRLSWDNEHGAVTPILFAVAAYSVAFVEHHRGRLHEARRWLREADAHVANEDPPPVVFLVYLRAARLWMWWPGMAD